MANDRVELIRFVLDHADQAPLKRRIQVYRGLAGICGEETESKELQRIAAELEKADQRCQEFLFHFSRKEARQ